MTTPAKPDEKEIEEALKWVEQPLDRVITRDLPAARAMQTLAKAYASSKEVIAQMAADLAALKDSSTETPIPFSERQYPTRQDMRLEIAALTAKLADEGAKRDKCIDKINELCAKIEDYERQEVRHLDVTRGLEERVRAAEEVVKAAFRYFISPKVDNNYEIRTAVEAYRSKYPTVEAPPQGENR
jgi:septal ring factor EnvC (AmiA/AmiB activator)